MGGFTLTDFQCSEGDYADYRLYTGGQAFLYDGDVLVATFENVTMEGNVDYISQSMTGSGTAQVVEAGTYVRVGILEYASLVPLAGSPESAHVLFLPNHIFPLSKSTAN